MKARSTAPERLDVETPPREMMARVVGYLAWVNRWLGGASAVARHLKGETGTVLDVGAGAGDIARALPPGKSERAVPKSGWNNVSCTKAASPTT